MFDLVIWVDASDRLPLEDKESFNIDKSCAHIILDNNGTIDGLYQQVQQVITSPEQGHLAAIERLPYAEFSDNLHISS